MVEVGAMSYDRLLGIIAAASGNREQAANHFEDAIAFYRPRGLRPELAWSLCAYADLLRDRDAPGDKQKATTLLTESLAISSELGMKPLVERVLARKTILGA